VDFVRIIDESARFQPQSELNNSVDWALVSLIALPLLGVVAIWAIVHAI
jgi:hypothetical protein